MNEVQQQPPQQSACMVMIQQCWMCQCRI